MLPTPLQPRAKGRAVRAAAALLAALALVTCAEDPIGPATGQGRLHILPVFGPYARIAPLTLDQVRIVVERQDSRTETSDTIVDKVRAFDVNRDQLRIDDIFVRMQVASEDLLVTLQLLSDGTLLFQGSQIVPVVRGQSTPQTSIPVSYQGPGANVASLTLAPRDTVLSPGATLDYRLDAFDIQGAPVAQYYVSWSLTGGPAAGAGINAAGRLTAPSVPDTFFVKVVAPNGVVDSTQAIVGSGTVPPASFAWTGAVSTDWSVAGNWNPAQVPGFLDSVVIGTVASNRQPSLSAVTVVGAVSLIAGGNLTINGQGLSIARGLTTGGTGVLTMTNGADVVVVGGNAVFDGGSELNLLTAGGMSVGGNLTQAASTSGDSYHPSGTHLTLLAGAAPTLSFATPGTSQFQDLAWVGTGTLTLATPAMAQGTLVVNAGTTSTISSASGARLTVGDLVSVSAVVLNNVPLTLSQTAPGSLTLSNVTFQNMPTTVSQLVVSHPGGTFDFANLVFGTTPVAPNGFYLDVTDNTGPADGILTINMVTPSPGTGGAFFKTTGGAVVNWPAGAGGTTRTWTGAVNTDWSTPGNWSPAQVPTGTDDVVIPATGNAPTASNTCAAKTLTVNTGSTLNLAAITCQVGGNVFADGTITGGTMQINGAASVRGTIATLTVAGTVTVTGNMALANNLIVSSGDLTLNGHSVTVGNVLATQGSGTLTMTNPADQLTVVNLADFSGGSTTGKLTAGQLILQGNFNQGGATTSFAPSGTHLTTLASSLGNVSFANPGSSSFQDLTVTGNTQRLASDLQVKGMLTATQTTLQAPAPPHTVTAGGVSVHVMGLSGLRFVIQGGPIVQFDTVSFSNSQPTTAQLTVNHPGAATPFIFHDIQFATTPTAPNGFYVAATDLAPGDGLPLVINMREPQPLNPTGFVLATGGATVTWPQALTLTWTGATSQFFGTASNWNPANAPTIVDDVIIPATARQPVMTGGVSVHNMTVQPGVTVTLGPSLSIGADLVNDGTINGSTQTVMILTGGGNLVRGNGVLQTPTVITGHYTMSGNLNLRPTGAGALALSGTAQLILNGHTLNDSTPFALSNSATVVMTNPLDSLILGGFPAMFDGGDETNRLTSGVVVLTQASLVQANTNGAGNSFVSLGNHKVAVRGSSGSITLATPASAPISQFECGSTGGVGCTFGSNVTVTGNVVVPGSGLLVPSGRTLTIGVGLTTTGTGRLAMLNANDSILVGANATFAGGTTTNLLTQGVLLVKGDFTQSAVTSTTSYSPSGTHKTVLGDAAARAISIGSPGALTAGSHFQVLDVSNATGGLSLDVNMQADSLISNSAAAKLTSAGVMLTVRRAQVSGLILDNTRFILDEQGTFTTENFSNVAFTGFPVPTTSTTMLTVQGPGSAVAARPAVTTTNVNFQSLAIGANNFYVDLTSSNGATFNMTMTGSNQSPQVGGNGPALTRTTPTGVATVSWP